jgi:hypothetical protein
LFAFIVGACAAALLTSCQTTAHFAAPAADWKARAGQLQYRGAKTTLIGEVLVRYSGRGDFELTFTKGPGVPLLMVQQNPTFVRVSGPLARGSWSGPPADVPARLRGWTELRDLLMQVGDKRALRHNSGGDKFLFEF